MPGRGDLRLLRCLHPILAIQMPNLRAVSRLLPQLEGSGDNTSDRPDRYRGVESELNGSKHEDSR